MVRPRSGLLTTSVRELVMVCKGGHLREIGLPGGSKSILQSLCHF